MEEYSVRHRGRVSQTFIYLGKLFRMFLFQNDWKVLPMAAVIAGLVAFSVGANLYKTMEGTLMGTFALSCICIWNGFFNSIQVICRERAIVKREHRSGLHISSYIAAHMIYQAFLCLLQVIITIGVCMLMNVKLPVGSLITPWPIVDFGISLFFYNLLRRYAGTAGFGVFKDHYNSDDCHAVSFDRTALVLGGLFQPSA